MTDKPTREQALAIARAKKEGRRRRTSRIRRSVAVFAVAAFIGPLGAIYSHEKATQTSTVAAVVHTSTGSTSTGTTSTGTTSSGTAPTTSTSTPSAVTTQQS